jgi:hypothetical protein
LEDHAVLRFAVIGLATLGLSACSSPYHGPVSVHETLELQTSFVASGSTCHGTNAWSEYTAGRRLVVVDQSSQAVSSPMLPTGVLSRGNCDFHLTLTLPKADRSLWLPMSELGFSRCNTTQRGAALFDRTVVSTSTINAALALNGKGASKGVPRRCS